MAMPYRCLTEQMAGDKPVFNLKINPKAVRVLPDGSRWERYVVGITPALAKKFVAYGTGNLDKDSIGLTFIENDSISGYLKAQATDEEGVFSGEVRISAVRPVLIHKVSCRDLEIHPES